MKRNLSLLLISILLSSCSKPNIGSSSSNPISNESTITESSSKELDYGTVTFNNIEIYPDGYDGTIIRPHFSNLEVEGLVDFTYTVEDESICEIDEENKVRYISTGRTKVNVTSEYYEDTYFYVNCLNSMMPEFVFQTAKSMTKSVYNSYEEGDTLFVGDSFFQFWRDGATGVTRFSKSFEGYKVFNIGISASTTHDWRAMNDNTVSFTSPKNIVINIGINNVDDDGETGVRCYRNVKSLVDDYLEMFDDTQIYYLSITKCTGVFANKWSEHSMSNTMMEKYCKTNERLHYLDVNALFGNSHAEYQSDGLHPNQKGYDLFEQIIKENVELEAK